MCEYLVFYFLIAVLQSLLLKIEYHYISVIICFLKGVMHDHLLSIWTKMQLLNKKTGEPIKIIILKTTEEKGVGLRGIMSCP